MAYQPTPIPQEGITPAYLQEELLRIAADLGMVEEGRYLPVLYAAPKKPREGMLVRADGASWNPGFGAGYYEYITGAWLPVGRQEALVNGLLPAFCVDSSSYATETAITTPRTIGGSSAGNTVLLNNGAHFDSGTGRFTAPVAGLYQFAARCSRSGGHTRLDLTKNGVTYATGSLSYGTDWQTAVMEHILALAAGDYVQAVYSPVNGTTCAIFSSCFSGFLLIKT